MAKIVYTKPPLSIADQVGKLVARGLEGDPAEMARILEAVNYYRLSGYTYPFRDHTNDRYLPGTSIDLIWNLYTLDQHLRLLCFKAIDPANPWRNEIKTLFASHPEARPTHRMGAPAGWETTAFWN